MTRRPALLRRLAAAAVLVAAAACGSEDENPLSYQNRRPFEPPMFLYVGWWGELESCAERSRNLDGIQWFVADWISGGSNVKGQWLSTREITLRSDVTTEERVVKHEMLHDLLDGDGAHRNPSWETCVPPFPET